MGREGSLKGNETLNPCRRSFEDACVMDRPALDPVYFHSTWDTVSSSARFSIQV